jgi:hypothetical protein
VIKTICDVDIKENVEISDLIKSLVKSNVNMEIAFKDTSSGYLYNREKCRLENLDTEKNTVDILVNRDNRNVFHMRGILLSDLISIKIVTEHHNIIAGNQELTRFDLLDITEEKKDADSK